jgi:RNA:NAD 2'-phosphotransferase (TPT1/KptA family)
MWSAGFKFVRSASGVWLTSVVPAEFIQFPHQPAQEGQ